MNMASLVLGIARGALGGRRKRSHNALSLLTGARGELLSNPALLLTGLGVAWGVVEAIGGKGSGGSVGSVGSVGSEGSIGSGGSTGSTGSSGSTGSGGSMGSVPPPLPAGADEDRSLLLVRLAISAANADGALNDEERAAVVRQATELGEKDLVERELATPRPLPSLVAGITDPAERAALYVLAFTIVRADEDVTGGERIYLAQLAHLLGLDTNMVARLEKDVGERIDALGDQGQLGG